MKPASDQEMYRKLGGLVSWLWVESRTYAAMLAVIQREFKRETGLVPLDAESDAIAMYRRTPYKGLTLGGLRTWLHEDKDAPQFAEFVGEVETRLKELGEES